MIETVAVILAALVIIALAPFVGALAFYFGGLVIAVVLAGVLGALGALTLSRVGP